MSEVVAVSALAAEADSVFREAGEPEQLLALRAKALGIYEDLPVPHYEKSDISRRKLDAFVVKQDASTVGEDWRSLASAYMDETSSSPLIVFADGQVVLTRGLEELAQSGVQCMPLREAILKWPEKLIAKLFTAVPYADDKMLALHAGLWRSGVYIQVGRGVQCTEPLQILHVTTREGEGSFPHNLIVADEGSQVTVQEAYLAAPSLGDHLHVGVSEVFVGPGALVKDGIITDLPRHFTTIVMRRALVERDGSMDWVLGEVGDGYTVSEVGSRLIGQGSKSTSHAIVLGTGRAHADMTARMVHEAKFSESDTTARGVMQGRAFGVYRGVTHILKGASGSNGQQSEKLLMMSPESRADAIPMLLIDENDVKCGHAASVGQINEEQLFYLMSRGISEADAKRMVVWGFLDPVLAELPIDSVRTAVERVLERKMK